VATGRLVSGPGWPAGVREEPTAARTGREDRRTPLACFVQFTDLHLADVQNPLRTEFLRARSATAWRPQEALTVAGAVALVEQVNALRAGPHTGLPPAFVMTTGDNLDNNAAIELEWFLTLMSGGRITPNTGDPAPARSFREVNTASHVDYPHHARLLELADDGDGTVSLFTTLVESAAPHRTSADFSDLSATGLASLYREPAHNAPGLAEGMRAGIQEGWAGGPGDRNAELLKVRT
jgi:hypothetical protein